MVLFGTGAFAQRVLVTDAKKKEITALAVQLNAAHKINFQKALALAKSKGWAVRRQTTNGRIISLQGINTLGFPVYLTTHNTEAAAATRTNAVQPGGELNLNLSGSSNFLNGKLAIWDGGTVFRTHQEFAGKTITLGAGQGGSVEHSTHVAGTMIAKGVVPLAKGMAFDANTLLSYDFDDDVSEMTAASPNLLISNHSYGDIAGWDRNVGENRWDWYGLPGDTEDYIFGYYDNRAQDFDRIAYNAPYYLIVESAGNSHAYTGPAVGATYWGYQSRTDQTFVNKGPRPANISSNNGFDVISTTGNAKNILTVGAVNQLPNGPTNSSDVRIASFSSWGPTDDGRVKPDIVGMGVNVYSTLNSGINQYGIESGTSMSSPNVSGSLILLQEYYGQLHHDSLMRAATLKGLACHTAFDAGNVGPDYKFGWGLLDMRKAAQAITDMGIKSAINENTIQQGQVQNFVTKAIGDEPLIATISWTDPEGTVAAAGTLNDRTPKLINDLDISVTDGAGIFNPWMLDPANPDALATTGNNIRDNIEQVYIANPVAGKDYTITITNKGTLKGGSQKYSVILTGGNLTGIDAAVVTESLSAYPIPANNTLNVLLNVKTAGQLTLNVYDMMGQNMHTEKANVAAGVYSKPLNVGSLSTGIYILKIATGQQVYTKKFIVAR
ncbi:hypothetical protein GCM10023149_26520 [Mucilaginibacter gynuensis]|uniref:Secreted protein (Por secretion system target) n=1 Tax=Mucilaginibacter gynuensis TaxID=1302236 RepID=A0ABP8GI90_9SPHI